MEKLKLIEYTQAHGFREIEIESDDGSIGSWVERNFGSPEEGDGSMVGGESVIDHYYRDPNGEQDGHHVTMIEGACRWEVILTRNNADFIALRALLAPVAVAQTLDAILYELSNHQRKR